jgi:Ran GTPase-activating protein (RanGAP) involved in mRNA processing and transport
MALFKRQSIQKLIIDQAGSERLVLNDLIIGREGAEALAQLIPQYHGNLLHLEIKGNNIDSEGFEAVCMALMHCPGLVSLQAEWNNAGSSLAGLAALLYLVRNLRFLELVDLKNNKLTHQHAEIIADIIRSNSRSLKVLDLRWNDLGEVGAQAIFPALAANAHLRSLPLDDNRMASNTLAQFADLLRNPTRGSAPVAVPKQERVLP